MEGGRQSQQEAPCWRFKDGTLETAEGSWSQEGGAHGVSVMAWLNSHASSAHPGLVTHGVTLNLLSSSFLSYKVGIVLEPTTKRED